jgi:hypothetical protein
MTIVRKNKGDQNEMKIQKANQRYTYIFRQGGRDRVRWRRTLESWKTAQDARQAAEETEAMGYACRVYKIADLEAHGLPVGYDGNDSWQDWEEGADGFWWRVKR